MAIAAGWVRRRWGLLAAVLVLAGCAPLPEHPNTFLLKMEPPDVQQASEKLLAQMEVALSQVGLATGYPNRGTVATTEDPNDPAVSVNACRSEGSTAGHQDCLVLSRNGDYLMIQPITWQSAAFHPYRMYVVPDEIFVSFDPAQDYVAIDVILMPGSVGWEPVQAAIELAAEALGARPIAP